MTLLLQDQQLLRQFKAGESQALAAVYRHYLALVAEIVCQGFVFESEGRRMRYVGARSPFDADDLIADIFARAFRPAARDTYDGLRPYANYLKTIARNTIIDGLRQSNPLSRHLCEPLDVDLAATATGARVPTPLEQLEQSEVLQLATAFVAQLDERDRAIIRLRFVDGGTQTEVAAALGLSVPTLRKHERRVIYAFFRYMKQRGYFEQHRSSGKLGAFLAGVLVLALVRHGLLA